MKLKRHLAQLRQTLNKSETGEKRARERAKDIESDYQRSLRDLNENHTSEIKKLQTKLEHKNRLIEQLKQKKSLLSQELSLYETEL